ncbi:MAG: WD40 repeat domain-containing protein [Candidatus Acidiferrales bacterium]
MPNTLRPALLVLVSFAMCLSLSAQTPESVAGTHQTDPSDRSALSADDLAIARDCWGGTAAHWEGLTKQALRNQVTYGGSITSVAFSPDGSALASGCWGGAVRLWDVATGREFRTLTGHECAVTSIAFSPDGNSIASASGCGSADDSIGNNTIRLWDVTTGHFRAAVATGGRIVAVDAASFSPDGRIYVTANDYPSDGSIMVWDAATGQYLSTLYAEAGVVIDVAFSADGRTLAAATSARAVTQWDAATWQEISSFVAGDPHNLTSVPVRLMAVAFSPDGSAVALGSGRDVQLWDLATQREILTLSSDDGGVYSIAFSPDGRTLASGTNSRITIWNLTSGQEIRTLKGHAQDVYAVSFSPDGRTLASGSFDKTIKLWDLATGQLIRTLGGPALEASSASASH